MGGDWSGTMTEHRPDWSSFQCSESAVDSSVFGVILCPVLKFHSLIKIKIRRVLWWGPEEYDQYEGPSNCLTTCISKTCLCESKGQSPLIAQYESLSLRLSPEGVYYLRRNKNSFHFFFHLIFFLCQYIY